MKRLAATNVVAQGPHKQTNAVKSRKWRPAVEHIGMDVHKRESQLCIILPGLKDPFEVAVLCANRTRIMFAYVD